SPVAKLDTRIRRPLRSTSFIANRLSISVSGMLLWQSLDLKLSCGWGEQEEVPMSNGQIGRRDLITTGLGLALGASATQVFGQPATGIDPEKGVTAPEDLMKEHGVLNRCLLIYEDGIRRIQSKLECQPEVFHETAQLIRTFVEEYHEKNEETFIFPEFE